MRIVVLGSTSRTGLCLLAGAQRRGHQIVAFTRRPQVISTSDLEWVIARLNRLTSKPATGAIITSTSLLAKARPHTRADAASILLDLAGNTTAVQTAINVSGA